MTYLTFACTKIREIRQKEGMSQMDFARKLGIVQTHLSNIEKGKRNPTLEIIMQLYKMYGIPPNEILGINEDNPLPDPPDIKELIKKEVNEALAKQSSKGFAG